MGPIEETAEEAVEEEAEVNGNSVEPEVVDDEKFKEKLECNYAFGEVDVDHVYTNSQNIFYYVYQSDYLILLRSYIYEPLANINDDDNDTPI